MKMDHLPNDNCWRQNACRERTENLKSLGVHFLVLLDMKRNLPFPLCFLNFLKLVHCYVVLLHMKNFVDLPPICSTTQFKKGFKRKKAEY